MLALLDNTDPVIRLPQPNVLRLKHTISIESGRSSSAVAAALIASNVHQRLGARRSCGLHRRPCRIFHHQDLSLSRRYFCGLARALRALSAIRWCVTSDPSHAHCTTRVEEPKNTPLDRNTRYSVRELERWAEQGHRKPLEDLIRAWRGIQNLPVNDPNSFWVIAGYHGSPLAPFDENYPHLPPPFAWWGGYCHHGNVLFPAWHRAYMQHLEDALRTQVPDVSMAYWDKSSTESSVQGLPKSLTDERMLLDGEMVRNPFASYTFPVDIEPCARFKRPKETVADFSKRAGARTQRYPMSGFYGSKLENVAEVGKVHNDEMRKLYPIHEDRVRALNSNVLFTLTGSVSEKEWTHDPTLKGGGETCGRLKSCLCAPTFNILSNNNSAGKWFTSLEQPHDEMHLAIGGQDSRRSKKKGQQYSKDGSTPLTKDNTEEHKPIPGSHGDMGENETAAFDPIFFFHHCNIDRIFWVWQKKWRKTAKGSLEIDPSDLEGTFGQNPKGQGGNRAVPGTTRLTMDTPLQPFKSASGAFYTSRDVVDLENQLGRTYSLGSLDQEDWPEKVEEKAGPELIFSVMNINKANFLGSFKIILFHQDAASKALSLVGSVSVLSRWNLKRCQNCQIHLQRDAHVDLTPLKQKLSVNDVTKEIFIVHFVDRSTSMETPVAASGKHADGKWTPLTGCDKIETVFIELDTND